MLLLIHLSTNSAIKLTYYVTLLIRKIVSDFPTMKYMCMILNYQGDRDNKMVLAKAKRLYDQMVT